MLRYYDIHTHRHPANPDITAILSVDTMNPVMPLYRYCSIGIHPHHADMAGLPELEILVKHPNVVAVGEAGLDKLAPIPLKQQKELFIAHIELAEKNRKPLIIHCVKAWPELIEIRKQFTSVVPWIIHGFRGNDELARQMLQFGFYISFGLHFHSEALRTVWETHRLYAETDDSHISIEDVYQRITSQLSITTEDLSDEILKNLQSWPVPLLNHS